MSYIKLECQKMNLKPFLFSTLGIICFNLFMVLMMAIAGPMEYLTFTMSFKDQLIVFNQVLIQSCFAVLAAALFSKIVIEEYRSPSVTLLFSYPISRKRIILSKMLVVSCWTLIGTIVSVILCMSALAFFADFIPLLNDQELSLSWKNILGKAFISSVLALAMGFISLAIGFRKKSIISTMVTAVILCSVLSNSVQVENNYFLLSIYSLILLVSVGAAASVVIQAGKLEE